MNKKNRISFISIFFISFLCFSFAFTAKKGIAYFLYAEKVKGMSIDGECTDEIRDYFDKYIIFYDLPGEQIAAGIDSNTSYFLTGNIASQQVISGKEKWLFYKSTIDGDSLEDYIGEARYTDEEMKEVLNHVSTVQQYWEKQNAEFLYIVPPNKENIYNEYMPNSIERISNISRGDVIADFLKNSGINIVNLKPILRDSLVSNPTYKDKELYYKYDTHWNQLGAEIAVEQILKEFGEKAIPIEVNDIETSNLTDHISAERDLAATAGLKWYFTDEIDYSISVNPVIDWNNLENEIGQNGNAIIDNNNAVYDKTILIIGDSFRIAMIPSLSRYFSKVIVITGNDEYKDYSVYNPDYVVYERVERYTGNTE